MDDFTRNQFRRAEPDEIIHVPEVSGREIKDCYLDPGYAVVITFTDGTHLLIHEHGQTGWMSAEVCDTVMLAKEKSDA